MSTAPWVLVTDGGCGQDRASLAAVRALRRAGYRVAVAGSGPGSLAAASRHAERWIPVPSAGDPAYPVAIREILDAGPFLTVLPSSDAALLALDAPVRHLVDKQMLASTASAAGFVVPESRTFGSRAELLTAADGLPYPAVVKPATKDPGSPTSAFRADGPDDLAAGAKEGVVVVQPFVFEPLWAVAGVVWEGRVVASVRQRYLRTWPSDCGTASAAVTVEADRDLEERLPALLAPYQGVFQAQFAGPCLLDVNPRIYGSLPLAVAAGVNLPALWCDLVAGRADGTGPVRRGRPDVYYRWIEGDVRNLVEGVRRGHLSAGGAVARFRPRRGAAHSTESAGDPGPMLARLGYAVRRARAVSG